MKPLRHTRQRQVILEELRKLKTHPTAAELHDVTKRLLPRLSLGTIYRNLEVLARNGLVLKLEMSGKEARFDGDVQPHLHVRCVACGRVSDIFDIAMDSIVPQYKTLNGYEILGFRMEYVGLCPECRAETNPDAEKKRKKRRQ